MCVFCQERYLGELCDGDVPSFSSPERSKILEIFPYPQLSLMSSVPDALKERYFFANLGKLGEQMPSKCTVSHHASSKLWGQLVASAPASTKATTWLRRRRPTPASAAASSSSSNLQPHDIIPEASQKMLQPEIKFHLRLNAVGTSLWYIAAMIQGLICKTWQNLQLTIGNNG